MSKRLKNAAERAARRCETRFTSVHSEIDCKQGVVYMWRIVRKQKASTAVALDAAEKVCATNSEYTGPRVRCQIGARQLAKELGHYER